MRLEQLKARICVMNAGRQTAVLNPQNNHCQLHWGGVRLPMIRPYHAIRHISELWTNRKSKGKLTSGSIDGWVLKTEVPLFAGPKAGFFLGLIGRY